MNDILMAERDIQNYLYHEHDTTVNFVLRQYEYEKYSFPQDYAIQCTTHGGLFKKMVQLVEDLNIEHTIFKDKATVKCIVLKDKKDVLKIAGHIQEVEL